jgi:hypothetical protein
MCAVAVPICTLLAIFGDRASAAAYTYYEAHKPHVHVHVPTRLRRFLHRYSPAPK